MLNNQHGKLRSRVVGSFGNGSMAVGDPLVAVGRLRGELARADEEVVGDFSSA